MTANGVSIGILGATGYTGVELLRLVQDHPSVRVACMTSERYAGQPIAAVFPHLAGRALPTLAEDRGHRAGKLDVVFGCLPHGTTQDVVRALPRGPKVIDISADFRLRDPKLYERVYGQPHRATERQRDAVYGLTELAREAIRETDLVANPGCYPTTAQLPLRPLLEAGLIAHDPIIIDAKSGVTGAGRAAKESLAAQRGQRGPARLRRRQPPPRAGDRAGPGRGRGRAGHGDLHAAPRADEPRHPRHDLRAPRRRRRRRGPAARRSSGATARSPSSTCCRSRACPRPATCAAPTSA